MQSRPKQDNTILIVDDEELLLATLAEFFANQGFSVLKATNVADAVALNESENPSLIITDVRMPGSKGTDLVQLLSRDVFTRPIIFCMSGFTDLTAAEAYNMGIDLFFQKPFDLREMLAAANHYLKSHSRVRSLLHKMGRNQTQTAHNLDSLLKSVNDLVLIINKSGELIAWSRSFEGHVEKGAKPRHGVRLETLLNAKNLPMLGSILKNTTADEPQDEVLTIAERDGGEKSYLFSSSVCKWDESEAIVLIGRICQPR
jgi:FixJ family two-component response regulator